MKRFLLPLITILTITFSFSEPVKKKGVFGTIKSPQDSSLNHVGLPVLLTGTKTLKDDTDASTTESADIFGRGGPAKGIDAILSSNASIPKKSWLERTTESAENGERGSMVLLGYHYCFESSPKQYTLAFKYFKMAADLGHEGSMNYLGRMYSEGWGVEQNDSIAFELYVKSAQSGYGPANCNVAYQYQEGEGVEENIDSAIVWYTKAAEQDIPRGMYYLGILYSRKSDWYASFDWYLKAAQNKYADAYDILAEFYNEGTGTIRDAEKALHWYKKAGEYGDAYSSMKAGEKYQFLKKDFSQAMIWYKKAVLGRNGLAAWALGDMYEKGKGIDVDLDSARFYFLKAQKWGIQSARKRLANIGAATHHPYNQQADDSARYYNTLGYKASNRRNKDKAIEHYKKALEFLIKAVGPEDMSVARQYRKIAEQHGDITAHIPNKYDMLSRLKYLKKALVLYEKYHTYSDIALPLLYVSIGDVHESIVEFESAKDFYTKALNLYLNENSRCHSNVPDLYSKIIRINIDLGEFKEAYANLETMIDYEIKLHGSNRYNQGFFFDVLAVNIGEKEHRKAMKYCKKALALEIEKLGESHGRVRSRLKTIANLYEEMGDTEKAEEYKKRATM